MPRLLPIDLANAQFSRAKIGGYRTDEVDAILDRAATALEELTAENEDLRTQVLRLRTELDQMRGEERLVKEAIVSAQRAAELLRADAGREADLIREEARQQARSERSQAQKDADTLRDQVESLKSQRKRFLAEHRALLQKSLRELDEIDPATPALTPAPTPTQAVVAAPVPSPVAPMPTETVPFLQPRAEASSQSYPTRLPPNTRPLDPVIPPVSEPTIVEDENGEKWVN